MSTVMMGMEEEHLRHVVGLDKFRHQSEGVVGRPW